MVFRGVSPGKDAQAARQARQGWGMQGRVEVYGVGVYEAGEEDVG